MFKIVISMLMSYSFFAQGDLQFPTLSPFSAISQEIGLTEIKLTYARPSAKGRTIYGDLVPYDEVWRTGANASTKLTFTEDVKIAGNALKAGTYALYTIPGKESWTIIIHNNIKLRSIAGDAYKAENDAFRFIVKAQTTTPYVETFTIQFTDLHTKGLNVALSWANTIVSFPIEVEVDAKIESQMAELLKNESQIKHGTFFKAAEYYLHNDKNLKTALEWINKALVLSKENFRYGLLKAKIEYKSGDKDSAMKTIKAANAWAKEKNNSNYIGQTDLFMKEMQN